MSPVYCDASTQTRRSNATNSWRMCAAPCALRVQQPGIGRQPESCVQHLQVSQEFNCLTYCQSKFCDVEYSKRHWQHDKGWQIDPALRPAECACSMPFGSLEPCVSVPGCSASHSVWRPGVFAAWTIGVCGPATCVGCTPHWLRSWRPDTNLRIQKGNPLQRAVTLHTQAAQVDLLG
jgi:hypothetical protein